MDELIVNFVVKQDVKSFEKWQRELIRAEVKINFGTSVSCSVVRGWVSLVRDSKEQTRYSEAFQGKNKK